MHSVLDLLDILFRRRRAIACAFIGLTFAFGAYLALTPRVYESRVRFLLKKNRTSVVAGAGETSSDPSAQMSDAEMASQVATELELMSATPVLRKVVTQALSPNEPGKNPEAEIQLQMDSLGRTLRIGPVLRSNLIDVEYSDTEPARAQKVLQVLTKEYLDRHLALRGGKANYEFFAKQARDYKAVLETAQADLANFQVETKVLALREQRDQGIRTLAESMRAQSEAEALRAELEKRSSVLRTQIDGAPARIGTTRRTVPNQYSVERLNTLMVELRNKRTELLTKFRSDDRLVTQVDKQIEETRLALDRVGQLVSSEETSDVNPLRQQAEMELARTEQSLRGATARSEALALQSASQESALRKLALVGPRDADLVRRVHEAEQNYLLYAKKRDQLRVDGLLDEQKIANVVVVEPASLPVRAKPRVTPSLAALYVLLTGGAVFGVMAGGFFSRTFAVPRELEKFAGAPVLGTVSKNGWSRRNKLPVGRPTHYLQPVVERIRSMAEAHGRGVTFCLAGVNADDETSEVSRLIASELAASTGNPVLLVPSSIAEAPDGPRWSVELPVMELGTGVAVAMRPEALMESNGERLDWIWLGIPSEGFSCVLVETKPLDGCSPLPPGMRHAQGIFVVATAEKSKRSDVARSMRLLRGAGCEPAGLLLRERTYPIPEQIYRYL